MTLIEWQKEFETGIADVDHEHREDEYREHKADHDRLLDDLRDLMDDFEEGRWIDRAAFSERVGEWFSVHFRTRDARLHRRLG